MNYQREIEKKYIVLEATVEDIEDYVTNDLDGKVTEESQSAQDYFYSDPSVDFIRLRKNTNEQTIKKSDKGGTFNRIEENVVVKDFETAVRFWTLIKGNALVLTKNFTVYTLPNAIVLSVYTVEGAPELYLEVEGPTEELVDEVSGQFESSFALKREYRSLYDIFFGDE